MSRLERNKVLVIYAQERHHVETTFAMNLEVKHILPRNQPLGPVESVHSAGYYSVIKNKTI